MSVYVTSIIWRHYPSRAELLTALALADIADDRGYCIYADTSIEAIAIKTLQSPRAVQYHLQAMKQIGWLVVVGNEAGGRGHVTQYRIPVELVPLGGDAKRVQDLRHYENRQIAADADAQDVVVSDGERVQKMHSLSESGRKGAIFDTKGASFDVKGCKNQQPPNIGYVVHKTTYPVTAENFPLTPEMREWAKREGLLHPSLDAHHAYFIDYVNNKSGKPYKDLQAAFRNCVRSDWGRIRAGWKGGSVSVPSKVVGQCVERVAGEPCGMPGEPFGSEILCAHHKQKRLDARMPGQVRDQLGSILKLKRAG